jgi:hypothetical protein
LGAPQGLFDSDGDMHSTVPVQQPDHGWPTLLAVVVVPLWRKGKVAALLHVLIFSIGLRGRLQVAKVMSCASR